ncbi:MAG: glycoside hydrolase family 43 protein [Clostridiales bacterium]
MSIEKNKFELFTNPVIPGFYPDPSICRVKNNYYLVTSSFTYYPGIPIFKSTDLVNWKQIGYVLSRKEQLDLSGLGHSLGIFAPTIRYFKERFYVICTNVGKEGNFIVSSTRPESGWSDPIWLEGAEGIDPSLFFDDEKCYYTGTRGIKNGKYFGHNEIWLQEFDYENMKLVGEQYILWEGALKDTKWPEGPHIYKKDGWYYLMISEGGTGHFHALTIARSKNIKSRFKGYEGNPILTHRHLGVSYPIANVGHGDLVKTQNDEWWMILLASRPYGGYYRNLGRETFLAPVIWENDWPVISPGSGRVEFEYKYPNLPKGNKDSENIYDDFDNSNLKLVWNFLKTPIGDFWSLDSRKGFLRLKLKQEKLKDLDNPSFLGVRQRHMSYKARTIIEFEPEFDSESAGIVLLQSNEYFYKFEISKEKNNNVIRVIKCEKGVEEELKSCICNNRRIELIINANKQDICFSFINNNIESTLIDKVNGRILSTDVAGGFVGTYIGLFASGNGINSDNYVDFDLFEYKSI